MSACVDIDFVQLGILSVVALFQILTRNSVGAHFIRLLCVLSVKLLPATSQYIELSQ